MIDYHLSDAELRELRGDDRQAGDKREAYRINAVILLGNGWSVEQVAQSLLIDADTAPPHFKRHQQGGAKMLGHVALCGFLAQPDRTVVCAHWPKSGFTARPLLRSTDAPYQRFERR